VNRRRSPGDSTSWDGGTGKTKQWRARGRGWGSLTTIGGLRVNELELLERIREWLPAGGGARLIRGAGDDCAILRPAGAAEDWLATTDLFLEGVHFEADSCPAFDAGRRALCRGLSDIAAMGGRPRFCLISLSLGAGAGPGWVKRFYAGLLELARRTGTAVIGGDLAKGPETGCDVVVLGTVPKGGAMRRDRARPGQAIYVSGELGGSALGLQTRRGAAWKRHLRPEPRLELGRYLRRLGVKAAMDLSDGLSTDLHRLAKESGVAAVVDRPLPVFHGAGLEQALHGGEDYELLFTAPPRLKIPSRHRGVPLTRIGTIVRGEPGAVEFFGSPLEAGGWDHFAGERRRGSLRSRGG